MDHKNIFEEASKAAAESTFKIIKAEEVINKQKAELDEANRKIALYRSEHPGKEFQNLINAIEGPFAEKFMKIMNNLPDKEFIRYYLKTLEFVKPKISRKENDEGLSDQDNTIHVNIMRVGSDGTISTITLEEDEKRDV